MTSSNLEMVTVVVMVVMVVMVMVVVMVVAVYDERKKENHLLSL